MTRLYLRKSGRCRRIVSLDGDHRVAHFERPGIHYGLDIGWQLDLVQFGLVSQGVPQIIAGRVTVLTFP